MHREAWCASWRLTHNVVCCHRHSFLFKATVVSERNSNKQFTQSFPKLIITLPFFVTAVCCLSCLSLFSKTNPVSLSHSLLNPCSSALTPHTSLHMFEPSFSHPPLIYTNSTYNTNLSVLLCTSQAGQASPYLSKVTLPDPPTHCSNPCLYHHG